VYRKYEHTSAPVPVFLLVTIKANHTRNLVQTIIKAQYYFKGQPH